MNAISGNRINSNRYHAAIYIILSLKEDRYFYSLFTDILQILGIKLNMI
jgi:hypothetical protein